MKVFLKIVLWIAIIALVIFVVLFISMKVGQFESIPALLEYCWKQISGSFS